MNKMQYKKKCKYHVVEVQNKTEQSIKKSNHLPLLVFGFSYSKLMKSRNCYEES